ncbi:hypothetical protein ACROYT_G020464 [Oculina patagonica]
MNYRVHPRRFRPSACKSCNLKRREHPGAGVESLETTVQIVDDQQFHFKFKMADGRLEYWMLTYGAKYFKNDECEGKRYGSGFRLVYS